MNITALSPRSIDESVSSAKPILAVYRADDGDSWQDVEIIGRHGERLILRERGKQLPGIILASLYRVRIPDGLIEVPEIVCRKYLPRGMTGQQYEKYRVIRKVCGQAEALRWVFGP